MEFTIAYFWLIKLGISVFVGFSIWKSYKHILSTGNLKSVWFIFTVVGVLFMFYAPVKMNLGTQRVVNAANSSIKQLKVLPIKVVDNSFSKSSKLGSISDNEIWREHE